MDKSTESKKPKSKPRIATAPGQSGPLTARTDLESYATRGKGIAVDGGLHKGARLCEK